MAFVNRLARVNMSSGYNDGLRRVRTFGHLVWLAQNRTLGGRYRQQTAIVYNATIIQVVDAINTWKFMFLYSLP
jgi:hypothetical protein